MASSSVVDIIVYYGGKFQSKPVSHYSGGQVETFVMDVDYMCPNIMEDIAEKLNFSKNATAYYRENDVPFEKGLRLIFDDNSIRGLTASALSHGSIELYIDHALPEEIFDDGPDVEILDVQPISTSKSASYGKAKGSGKKGSRKKMSGKKGSGKNVAKDKFSESKFSEVKVADNRFAEGKFVNPNDDDENKEPEEASPQHNDEEEANDAKDSEEHQEDPHAANDEGDVNTNAEEQQEEVPSVGHPGEALSDALNSDGETSDEEYILARKTHKEYVRQIRVHGGGDGMNFEEQFENEDQVEAEEQVKDTEHGSPIRNMDPK